MKTAALKQALNHYQYDAAFGGARRTRKRAGPRNAFTVSATACISGTRRTSDRSFGTSTIRR